MNFEYWHDEVADIPTQDENGEWYDLETGIAFKQEESTTRTSGPRGEASEKTKAARGTAKEFGGKALKGSKRQKAWAEQIRAGFIPKLTEYQARLLCSNASLFGKAKFWIEIRETEAAKLGADVERLKELADKVAEFTREWNATGDQGERDQIMDRRKPALTEYNEIFGRLGAG